ncbi:MAG TPA: response regulator transcription factor [Chromatiaceae bacterium]|nr:response regulator transcription factor [Chromatiaceae bacterium]
MKTSEIRHILIVEDQEIIRKGLRALLAATKNFEVVGEAANGYEAISASKELKPDVILMGLSMPKMNGIESTRQIKRINDDAKILMLTSHCTEECVRDSLKAGAAGFLDKNCTPTELVQAINYTFLGQIYISPRLHNVIVSGYLEQSPELPQSTWSKLTARERQILKLVAEGIKNKDIAECLFICQKTVEKHRANLMRKLNLHNVPALTAYCIERGVIESGSMGY